MLTLRAPGFLLHITPVSTRFEEPGGPYLEWMDLHIQIAAEGIQAEGSWSGMPDEVHDFLRQLQAMDAELRPGQTAELAGAESGFALNLRMLERGAMAGDWRFQPAPPDGACAQGCFGMDQSFLGALSKNVEALLEFHRASKA